MKNILYFIKYIAYAICIFIVLALLFIFCGTIAFFVFLCIVFAFVINIFGGNNKIIINGKEISPIKFKNKNG